MEKVLVLFKEGKSFREIERITGVNRKAASRYVQGEGYTVTRRGTTGSRRRVEVDVNTFKRIDTAERSYWLGFLFADGALSTTTWVLEVTQRERDTVDRFRTFMKSTASIGRKSIRLQNKEYTAYRLNICSKEICEDLMRLGCTPRKSLNKKFPKLPKRWILPFIAGYFDGNGTVAFRPSSGSLYGTISTGSEEFAHTLLCHIREISGYGSCHKNKGGHSYTVYVPVGMIPLLEPYSMKIQNKRCPPAE